MLLRYVLASVLENGLCWRLHTIWRLGPEDLVNSISEHQVYPDSLYGYATWTVSRATVL